MDKHLLFERHEQATRMDQHELVRQLNSHLGPTLVAALANVRDRETSAQVGRCRRPDPSTGVVCAVAGGIGRGR